MKVFQKVIRIQWAIAAVALTFALLPGCRTGRMEVDLISADSSKVTAWEVIPRENPEERYKVEKTESGWVMRIGGKTAKPQDEYLRRALQQINKFISFTNLGDKKDSLEKYGLGKTATELKIYTGTTMTDHLIIGEAFFTDSNRYIAYYVKEAEGNRVYGVKLPLSGSLAATANSFRDNRMVAVKPEDIRSIRVLSSAGQMYEIYLVGNEILIDGKTGNTKRLAEYVNKVANLSVGKFGKPHEFGAEFAIEVNTRDKKQIMLKASRLSSDEWTLSSDANPDIFMSLNQQEWSALFPSITYFQESDL